MADFNRIEDLANATAYDVNGDKVGGVQDVYVNDTTGQPDFVSVSHGLFGGGDSIVPLRGHTLENGDLHLAFAKDRIEDAPDLDENGHLTNADQEAFYRHYGLEGVEERTTYETGAAGAGAPAAGAAAGAGAGAGAAAGQRTDADRAEFADREVADRTDANGEIIRSEEQLNVDKERVQSGEVRLRKYVVHETETVEVPVEREEVRVTREPITEADRANYDGNLGEQEASVTLHEERVNVSKESVPVEKVSLDKDVVRETETVTEDVAKERIETDGNVVDETLRDNK